MDYVLTGNVPEGNYTARYDGCEEFEGKFGPSLSHKWTLVGGEYDGEQVSRAVGTKPTMKNAAGDFLRAIVGRTPDRTERINFAKFVGEKYQVVVEQTESGSTRVKVAIRVTA